jgi:hypothetical protein
MGGAGHEVEFMTLAGQTVAVVTLNPAQLRSIEPEDIAPDGLAVAYDRVDNSRQPR